MKNVSSGEENRIIVEGEELIRGYGWAKRFLEQKFLLLSIAL